MEEYLSMTDLSASQFVKGSVCFLELCPVTNHPYSYYLFKLPTSETRLRLSLLTWLGATENNGCEGAKNKKTPYITHAQGWRSISLFSGKCSATDKVIDSINTRIEVLPSSNDKKNHDSWFNSVGNHLVPSDRVSLALHLSVWSEIFLKKNEWPMNNQDFKFWANYLHSIENNFVGTLSLNTLKALQNNNLDNSINYRSLVTKEGSFKKLLIDSGLKVKQTIWKILAVEILSKNSGSYTAGCDGVSFKRKLKESHISIDKQRIIKIIRNAKGKLNQSVARKKLRGIALSQREKDRKSLKTLVSKQIVSNLKKKLLRYPTFKDLSQNIIDHNNALKFSLYKSLNNNNIMRYKAKSVLRTYIPKEGGGFRPLGIPTLKDRALQMLLKVVMEPYMEPLGDNFSFGFRPGRDAHLAVSALYSKIRWFSKRSSLRKRSAGFRTKQILFKDLAKNHKQQFYNTQYILDADIEGCFDNISHDWLLNNVPMPSDFEFLLQRILQVSIVGHLSDFTYPVDDLKYYRGHKHKFAIIKSKEQNSIGVPQGGILSPLLANWTLDGLQGLIESNLKIPSSSSKKGFLRKFVNEEKLNTLLNKTTEKSEKEVFVKKDYRVSVAAGFVRYADDFIVVSNNIENLNYLKNLIDSFLEDRGLKLNNDKTTILKWSVGAKLDFLSWRFHIIKPKNKNFWLTKTIRQRAGRLSDWIGLYIYPTPQSTLNLRKNIKKWTSKKNSILSLDVIIKKLNQLITGWSNYYTPAPRLLHLKRNLDWYIFSKCKTFLMKKYGSNGYGPSFGRHLQNEFGKPTSLYIKGVKRKLQVYKLASFNTSASNWGLMKPTKELLKNSFFTNPVEYLKRRILLLSLKDDLRSKTFTIQKNICPVCSKNLIDLDKYKRNEVSFDGDTLNYENFSTDWSLLNSQDQYFRLRSWSSHLQLDHIIPKSWGTSIESLEKLLDKPINLRLTHKECHLSKTETDRRLLTSFMATRRSILKDKWKNKKLSQLSRSHRQELQILALQPFKDQNFDLFNIYLENEVLNHNDNKRNGQLKLLINEFVSIINNWNSENFLVKKLRSNKTILRKRFTNRKIVEARRSLRINTWKKS